MYRVFVTDPRLRHDWISRVPGLEIKSTFNADTEHYDPDQQHLLVYEPGDATHYEVSLSWARFAHLSHRLVQPGLDYLQFSVWSPASSHGGNGTMLIEVSGTNSSRIEDLDQIGDCLACSSYSAQVFSILIHGCLASHDINVARQGIQNFRGMSRLGFVDPDAV